MADKVGSENLEYVEKDVADGREITIKVPASPAPDDATGPYVHDASLEVEGYAIWDAGAGTLGNLSLRPPDVKDKDWEGVGLVSLARAVAKSGEFDPDVRLVKVEQVMDADEIRDKIAKGDVPSLPDITKDGDAGRGFEIGKGQDPKNAPELVNY